jgi:hypothetical protein
MSPAIDLTMLVLSAICVAEDDGSPMSARDIAFMLDIPRRRPPSVYKSSSRTAQLG